MTTRTTASLPSGLRWVIGPLLVMDVMLLLAVLALANVTATGPAQRALSQSVAVLTDVDTYLDQHYDAIQRDAQGPSETTIRLPDFPLDVTFMATEITSRDRGEFRELLLERSAETLHDKGTAAFRGDRDSEIDSASPAGAVRTTMDVMRPTPHNIFVGLTAVFAVTTIVLAAALAICIPGSNRWTAVGISVFVAGALFLIVAVAIRFMLRVATDGTDDEMTREFLRLAQELAWAPIRNGLVVSIGAALVVVMGLLSGRRQEPLGP